MTIPSLLRSTRAWIEACLALCILLAVVAALAAFGKARLTTEIYANRLQQTQQAYQQLRDQYNRAVARTAVTELRVTEDSITVVVRNDAGDIEEIPTPCDPRHEVYVDYVVLDGRLWIRRVFDSATEPRRGTLIDPSLGAVQWQDSTLNVGKAVYRHLTPGRWTVTVTGNGSLGLQESEGPADAVLQPAPEILSADTVTAHTAEATRRITLTEMISAAFGNAP